VTIVPAENACESAKRIAGRRYLVEQAPMIPLRECDVAECNCRYREFADRRQETRRLVDVGKEPDAYTGPERRVRKDRRKTGRDDPDNHYVDYFSR
jgi:hypothetical protein